MSQGVGSSCFAAYLRYRNAERAVLRGAWHGRYQWCQAKNESRSLVSSKQKTSFISPSPLCISVCDGQGPLDPRPSTIPSLPRRGAQCQPLSLLPEPCKSPEGGKQLTIGILAASRDRGLTNSLVDLQGYGCPRGTTAPASRRKR